MRPPTEHIVNGTMPNFKNDATAPPMAIVGMACRLPGSVTTLDEFWQLCSRRRSAWSEVPKDRFNAAGFYHPNPDRNGAINAQGGHFLHEDIGLFDAPFFNITLQEAIAMDPQQRLLLECTYEALENGGITRTDLAKREVGVFVGSSPSDYEAINYKDIETIPIQHVTGNAVSLLSNRISHFFNFNGPSFTVDTACSASLTAMHLACQSLRNGECSIAVVAGSHLNLLPDVFASYSRSRLLSDNGKCYSFDHKASGFGRGEGVGCLILKSNQDAVDDHDVIRALVVDTSINQDGRTQGIATPNPVSQAALMRSAYRNAGVDPINTGYVEAHGTGTKVGDPLEVSALHAVFSEERTPNNPLLIGSVKSNIGHTEGASGVISVIKTAMMLQNRFVLPTCGFEKPNEKIHLNEWNMKVPTKQLPWPRGKDYASVNNFGIGGSNAHVILKMPPPRVEPEDERDIPDGHMTDERHQISEMPRRVIVLSANDKDTALAQVKNLRIFLERNSDVYDPFLLSNLAYTLGQRRTHLPWRVALGGSLGKNLIAEMSGNISPSHCPEQPALGFAFTGQGAQWHAMGRELMLTYAAYGETLLTVDTILTSLGAEFSIIDELSKDETETSVSEAYMSQPACNAVQLALTDLLRSWGVQPSAVVGHSSGEIAAAYAAGILTLEQCVRIAYARGQAAQILADGAALHKGAMMAVPTSSDRVQPLLDVIERQGAVIACINSRSSVTVSGDEDAVDELEQALKEKGISASKLNVAVAYHSPHMRQVAKEFEDMMGKIEPQTSTVSFYSTVTGEKIDGSELNQSYWVKNLLSRVSFFQGMRRLLAGDESIKTLVEVGPHSVLQAPIKEIIGDDFSGQNIQYIPTLKRNRQAIETIQNTAVALFTAGSTLDFGAVNYPGTRSGKKKTPKLLVNLPKYPWNHSKRYWHQSRITMNHLHRKFPRNDILGSLVDDNIDLEPRWRNIIRLDHHPWIKQHRIFGESVYPMAGFFSMAVEGVLQQASLNGFVYDHAEFRDITLDKLLIIPQSSQVETMLSMKPCSTELHYPGNMWFEFHVYSWEASKGWEEHCHGFVTPQNKKQPNPVDAQDQDPTIKQTLSAGEESCTQVVDVSQMYKNLAASGLSYGPLFQGFSELSLGDGNRAMASFEVPDTRKYMPEEYETGCILHPIILDVCLQMIWPLCGFGKTGEHQLYFPASIKHLEISKQTQTAGTHLDIRSQRSQPDNTTGAVSQSFTMTNANDPTSFAIKIDGCIIKPVGRTSKAPKSQSPRSLCYKQVWKTCLDSVQERDNPLMQGTEARDLEGEQRMQLLRHVALIYIQRALEQIPQENMQQLRKHHQKLYKWMASTRPEDETAIYGKDEKAALIERTGTLSSAGELICKLGENLPGIISGKIRPLSLMPPGGLDMCFEELDCYRQSYSNAVTIIDKLVHQNPNLNILEVGAGTASATLPILENIGGSGSNTRRCSQYTYTDISPTALEDSKSKLQAWGHLMKYKPLDISTSPIGQGYTAHSYDLIIACNVLHSTPRVLQSLTNIKKLLQPGGKLLLVEEATMHPSLFGFATFPGWWQNEDMDRGTGPLMEKERWDESLLATGFSGIDLCLDDYPDSSEQSCCTLLSTTTGDVKIEQGPEFINKDVVIVQHQFTDAVLLEGFINSVCNLTRKAATITTLLHADVEGKLCIFLGEVDRAILAGLTPEVFQALQRLLTRSAGVLWVTGWGNGVQRPADLSICQGVSRTVRRETNSPIATLDLGDLREISQEHIVRMTTHVLRTVSACQSAPMSGDMEYSVRDGQLCVPRFVEDSHLDLTLQRETNQATQLQKLQQNKRPLTLATSESVPDGLHFTDDNTMAALLPSDFVEVQVVSAGLNFKDIVISMGEVAGKNLGVESSGIITAAGDRVQGLQVGDKVCALTFGSLSTTVRCPAANVCKKPEDLSMDLAASIPAVFCTAWYSLIELSRLQPDESMLIHSAAGGIGQAAMIIAQSIGATVFATVSTKEKKEYLVDTFNLNPGHIFYSRDLSFAEHVLEATSGRGVDVVINSLPGDALRASFECVAPFGRFVELGKREIQRNARLEMLPFDKNVSYTAVDLALAMNHNPKLVQKLLRNVFEKIASGVISLKQWSVASYSVSEVDDAFRALRGGRTIGKLVIQMTNNAMVKVHPARRPRKLLHPDSAYVIVGGTRGIGLEITPWMADNGARHFVLVSRSGLQTTKARDIIDTLTARGARVDLCQCDIGSQEDVGQHLTPLLKRVSKFGGVIFGPMILRDVMFEKMTHDDFETVIRPRVHGLWNVHNTLLSLNQRGDFFINLSSVSSTIGNLTQASYAASGSFMAAFEEHRTALGLPCSTIELAPVSGVGFVSRDETTQERVKDLLSNEWIDLTDIQGLFAAALRGDMKQSCNNHCITGLSGAKEPSAERLFWTMDPRFSHLLGRSSSTAANTTVQASTTTTQVSLEDTLSYTQDPDTIISTVAAAFVQKLSGILMIPAEEIDLLKPISAFGLDSLVAIDIRYWINSELQANLQLLEILTADSIYSLALVIACQSSIITDDLKTTCKEHFEKK